MRTVVLDSFTSDAGDLACWEPLRAHGPLDVHARTPATQTRERLAEAEAALTNKVRIDAALIDACPALRYIGVLATGTNVIDLDAARRRGICVTNVPGYSTASVAQLVFAFLLHHANDVAGHSAAVRTGRWAAGPDFTFCLRPMPELAGKTIAIVGMGAIGGAVARIATAFGMRVVAAQVPGSTSPGRVPLAQVLPEADVVTLHCPLTPATERMVDARFLGQMKPDAVLVNTGRGGLIDEAALLTALRNGRLGRACLDVLTQEPPPADHPLLQFDTPWAPRLVVTPHLAWATVEARRRLVGEAIANLIAFVAGNARNRVC